MAIETAQNVPNFIDVIAEDMGSHNIWHLSARELTRQRFKPRLKNTNGNCIN